MPGEGNARSLHRVKRGLDRTSAHGRGERRGGAPKGERVPLDARPRPKRIEVATSGAWRGPTGQLRLFGAPPPFIFLEAKDRDWLGRARMQMRRENEIACFTLPCRGRVASRSDAGWGRVCTAPPVALRATASPCRGGGLIPRPMEIRRRRRAPDVGLATLPGFWPLRRVLMPGPRLEIAEVLVDHLVEFAEEFDHLVVRVAVIGGDVVARAVAQRAPDDRDLALAEQVAGILQVDEIL